MIVRFQTYHIALPGRWRLLLALAALTLICGCATTPHVKTIAAQETVSLDYTCRLENGDILATTLQSIADDGNQEKSTAFVPTKAFGPVTLEIISDRQPPPAGVIRPILTEIAFQLSSQLEGLTYGESHQVTIRSEMIPDLPEAERFIQFSRVMKRPKTRILTKAQYIRSAGKEPKIGDVAFTRGIRKQVAEINEDQVVIEFMAEDGETVRTTFGEAVVRDQGDFYDLEIDARVGNLVRIGPYIGHISVVDERLFKVDYGHPFGGKPLDCQVTANPADPSVK
jgi:FKBP-type peptidyl-prolyl cis-trans isomerase 2